MGYFGKRVTIVIRFWECDSTHIGYAQLMNAFPNKNRIVIFIP